MATVLLVTRQESLAQKVRDLGKTLGNIVLRESTLLEDAAAIVTGEGIQVVLIHQVGAGDEKQILRIVQALAAMPQPCPVVVLAEVYQDAQAISFLRAGVADYLSLSQDFAKLALLLDVLTLGSRPARRPARAATPCAADAQRDPFYHVVTPEHTELMEHARRVAAQSSTLLFTGETGTGKTRLARLIHELSPRQQQPFLVVDCGTLSANLIESEMFGHVRGAFTGAEGDRQGKFAAAADGTLLLDEIHALPVALQAKLLRALDERTFEPLGTNQPLPFTARVMAATNVPLDQEVLAGRFRADLYYRLNVVGFFLPPLREQRDAIASLCRKLLAEFGGSRVTTIAAAVLEILVAYHWPGNVRELRNVIERAAALAQGPEVSVADLPERILRSVPEEPAPPARPVTPAAKAAANGTVNGAAARVMTLPQAREEIEIEKIRAVLRKHRNNRLRAALELGISRMGLYKKLHKYGLFDVNEA